MNPHLSRILMGRKKASFSPLDLPNLLFWFDCSDTSTITQISGKVSILGDKSGNGNNAFQATEANQPTTGTRTINGRNSLDFNTSTCRLELPSSAYSIATGNNTFFMVLTTDTPTSAAQPIIGFVGGSDSGYTINYGEGSGNNSEYKQGGSFAIGGQLMIADTPYIYAMKRNGTNLIGYRNGVQVGSINTASDRTLTTFLISRGNFNGAARAIDGKVAEIIACRESLNDDLFNKTDAYLKQKWGI